MIRQFELVEKVTHYDPKANLDALNKAYEFAMKVHGPQTRESGDPYFSHPLEVAGILCDMHLDTSTIITALLHDTVEDTLATLEDIRTLFGDEIATLVDGVTKLSKIELQSESTKQAENFRKLVLAMSNDLRVLLVKLADRLHNMRTLHHVKSEDKRKRVARETLEIYAPLAERIGIHHFKDELEDISFQILYPDARESILARLKYLEQEGGATIVQDIIDELKEILAADGLKAEVLGRMKRPYSIWRKMRKQNISIEQLSDIMAFRVVVDNVGQCYQSLGILHGHYRVIPGRFKDYISTPKPNNYQSLHTTLVGPQKQKVEIQIRTEHMHSIAEFGLAAHWQYKQGVQTREKQDYKWLQGLLEILENASNPEEFLEHTKLEMFSDQVFAFTPTGDLIALPRGSTPIDFAYSIHSEVGNHCVGAKINGRMMPLRTVLHNGDQVEILTAKSQSPSPTWERFVVTGKARAFIRKYIRTKKREQYVALGKSIIQKTFSHEGLEHSEKRLEPHLSMFKCATIEDLYAHIGEGQTSVHDVIRALHPGYSSKRQRQDKPGTLSGSMVAKNSDSSVSIRGLIPGMAVHYAGCCHPLPGDKIVGIVITGRGVTIHTYDCENLNNYLSEPDRWIDVGWDIPRSDKERFVGRLQVVILNQPGALASLTSCISTNMGNIVNLKIIHRSYDFFDVLVDVEVKSADHLENIIAALRMSQFVRSVERSKK
jgi:guanosine-3',5'-bis(diphosphate) 3'-pyrophosphohydrolase